MILACMGCPTTSVDTRLAEIYRHPLAQSDPGSVPYSSDGAVATNLAKQVAQFRMLQAALAPQHRMSNMLVGS